MIHFRRLLEGDVEPVLICNICHEPVQLRYEPSNDKASEWMACDKHYEQYVFEMERRRKNTAAAAAR
jgi:hypothetical protein